MKIKTILILSFLFLTVTTYGQQPFCADSSIRIKYTFGANGAALFNNPDTSGINIFTGEIVPINPATGIALLKTTWGDSIVWSKKISLNGTSRNSFPFPDGSILCTGYFGASANSELLLCKLNSNGNVQWAKRIQLSQNHLSYQYVSRSSIKNVFLTNNAIYVNAIFNFNSIQTNSYYNVITKLNLDGNIIWSKGFRILSPKVGAVIDAPVFYNNSVVFVANVAEFPGGVLTDAYTTLTRLNDTDGSVIEGYAYKTITDTLIKGATATFMNLNPDNSLSLTGTVAVLDIFGNIGGSNILFNTRINETLQPRHNFYYRNTIPLEATEFYYDFNNQQQHTVLSQSALNRYNKYFITFNKNDEVQRSREFIVPSNFPSIFRTSVNIDDKQNLHFIYHNLQAGKTITEYVRISNFAPSNTLGCVGKDTSILSRCPFGLSRQPFVWDEVQTDLITAIDVPYTEDTAIVTKELVCKIVSRCDSLKITGPANVCVGQPVRYSLTRNNGCFKNADWLMDTALVTIINTEGDSAITISFKKPFTGFLHAALTDCVVKDSLPVKAVAPLPKPLINRTDSVLCPGKTLLLTANNGFTNYLWQNSSPGQQLTVNTAGQYRITASDSCNNPVADSITVTFSDTTMTVIPSQTICLYDTAVITLPADVTNIVWQPTVNTMLRNNSLIAYPSQTTLYNITAERQVNCPISKTSQVVIKICPQTIFIPNAFTPNNDRKNDIFKPAISQTLLLYQFIIYNRYGQVVFETKNQSTGWDGTFKGTNQPAGGYMYQCQYRFIGKREELEKGYFILIR